MYSTWKSKAFGLNLGYWRTDPSIWSTPSDLDGAYPEAHTWETTQS